MADAVGLERDLVALAPEWEELAERTGATPFVRPGWFRAWWNAFGTGELDLLTLRRDSRLTGVLPLERRRGSVRLPVNSETSQFELVAEDRAALVRALFALRAPSIRLQLLDADDVRELRGAATGWRTIERPIERSPYVSTSGGFEAYARGRGAKLFADVRRRRRRLAEEGPVELSVADGRDRLDELMREGYALEGSGWKTAAGSSIASRPDARRFYDEVAQWAAERGWLRLAFLRVGGHAVAFQLGLEARGVYWFCKGGYDPAFHRFAPGKLLVHDMLERAFERGLESFELLGDAESWKLEWTDTVRERRALLAFAPTPTGRAAWAAEAYGRPLAKRLRVRRALELARRARGG